MFLNSYSKIIVATTEEGNFTTQAIVTVKEPVDEKPQIILTGDDVVNVRLTNISSDDGIYAADITINYDKQEFEFSDVENTIENFDIVGEAIDDSGNLRVILANTGGVIT